MYVYIFLNVNIYVSINGYLFKYIYLICKISLLLPHLFCNVEIEFSWFHISKQSSEKGYLNFKIDEYWNYWVLINDFRFALDSSDIDLWNIDLLDAHTFRFWRYRYPHFFVSKTSWRCFQDMSSGHLQDMSSRRLQDTSSRRVQDVFSVTIFRPPRRLQDVFTRRLEDVLEDGKMLRWRRIEDVFKTRHILKMSSIRLADQQMFGGRPLGLQVY